MKETEIFYWRHEDGTIEAHHISEFGSFLERETGTCVASMEYIKATKPDAQPFIIHREGSRDVVDKGSATEKG